MHMQEFWWALEVFLDAFYLWPVFVVSWLGLAVVHFCFKHSLPSDSSDCDTRPAPRRKVVVKSCAYCGTPAISAVCPQCGAPIKAYEVK